MTSAQPGITDEDHQWIRSVLSLIPKAVYGGDKPTALFAGIDGKDSVKKQKASKKSKPSRNKQKSAKPVVRDQDEPAGRAAIREKLQEKINEKRSDRKADDETQMEIRAHRKRKREEKKEEKAKEVKKIRREKKFENIKKEKGANAFPGHKQPKQSESQDESETGGHTEANDSVALETTRLAGFSAEQKRNQVKRRKLTGGKLRELQLQLEQATRESNLKDGTNTSSAKSIPGSQKMIVRPAKESSTDAVVDLEMDKALRRVTGVAVKDDVKKLKKSIRKERRKTEKSKEEWAKRVEALENEKIAKQERRTKHLKERKENKGKGKSSTKKSSKKRK